MKVKKIVTLLVTIIVLSSSIAFGSGNITGSTAADVSFQSGTLTLVEISALSFGSRTISAAMETYPAVESKAFLEVRDLRGTGKGWKITALASPFMQEDDKTLSGAAIRLINGVAVNKQAAGTAPSVMTNIRLDCDGVASDNIANAQIGSGLGVWSIEWNGNPGNNSNAVLEVPGGVATVGTHSAVITWTMADAP